MFDVIVIGGGVIGAAILRELTKYKLDICMLEKESDVCMGQSRANSGIVHAGFDAAEGTNKAKFNVLGNEMMEEYAAALGVKMKRTGSLVVAFNEAEVATLYNLKARGEKNGVKGLEILSGEQARALEPNLSESVVAALHAPTGGIVCPYELTIAAIGNAMDNGAKLYTDFEVVDIQKTGGHFYVVASDGRTAEGKIVVNCAGYGSENIARLAGDDALKIGARRGEYILLDRESGDFVKHTIFFTPTEKGKGILITPTVDGNILLGPTAEVIDGESKETSENGLNMIIEKAKMLCKGVPLYNTITSFAGVRAFSHTHDFIIWESEKVEGLIHCAGIESPGLSSAPAIAKYVTEEIIGNMLPLTPNQTFNGVRKPDYFFKNLSVEEKNELIKREPAYGKIVCRCEQITEGEILRAIRENPPATTVDGVKRRTRAGMGRCQGGFCQPHVAELIARELNIPFEEVKKSGKGSNLVLGVIK